MAQSKYYTVESGSNDLKPEKPNDSWPCTWSVAQVTEKAKAEELMTKANTLHQECTHWISEIPCQPEEALKPDWIDEKYFKLVK